MADQVRRGAARRGARGRWEAPRLWPSRSNSWFCYKGAGRPGLALDPLCRWAASPRSEWTPPGRGGPRETGPRCRPAPGIVHPERLLK